MFGYETQDEHRFKLIGPPAFPQFLVVESSRIDACMEYAEGNRNRLAGIAVAPLDGFQLPDLSFLRNFPGIQRLSILDSGMIDISAVEALSQLQYLKISGETKQSIDLSAFPHLQELRVDWWPKLLFGTSLTALSTLSLTKYAPKGDDLTCLSGIPKLENLDLVQAAKLTLRGIDQFPHLKKLTTAYLPRLVDLSPLTALRNGALHTLELTNSGKLTNQETVRVIKTLKRLAFNRCGEISSLAFLNDLPALESFSFVGTNVVDGDLTPCSRLRFAGFSDKRHYSHRYSDFRPA